MSSQLHLEAWWFGDSCQPGGALPSAKSSAAHRKSPCKHQTLSAWPRYEQGYQARKSAPSSTTKRPMDELELPRGHWRKQRVPALPSSHDDLFGRQSDVNAWLLPWNACKCDTDIDSDRWQPAQDGHAIPPPTHGRNPLDRQEADQSRSIKTSRIRSDLGKAVKHWFADDLATTS